MMREYSIKEQFALVALDGQNSEHYSVAKKIAIKGIAMAGFLQKILEGGMRDNILEISRYLHEKTKQVHKMKKKERNLIEWEIVQVLTEQNVLSKIPDLLGCDMDFHTAGVSMWQYKCEEEEYLKIIEGVRAEILEPGEVSEETVCLLYLFRECGCMHDIFSVKEQETVEQRLIELMTKEQLYKAILETEFHSSASNTYVAFIKKKHKLFQNPYLQGVNIVFPFFDRRQAIFIDMVVLKTTPEDRRETVARYVRENGHCCEIILRGEQHLLKIDNNYYKVWPYTRQCKFPIQGVKLIPVYQ